MHSVLKFLPTNFLTYAHIMAIYEIESCTILNSLPFKVKNNKVVLTQGKYSKLLDYANLLFTTIMMSTNILRLIQIIQTKDLKTTELLWYTYGGPYCRRGIHGNTALWNYTFPHIWIIRIPCLEWSGGLQLYFERQWKDSQDIRGNSGEV